VRHAVRAYRRSHENLLTLEEPIPNGRALPSEYEQQVENVEHWSPEIFLDCLGHEDLYLVCQRLQSRDKKILACFYGGQERDEQIAARLGMQPSTVKKRRQRAVQYLRQYMLGTENIPHRRSRKR
jgi:DNA-directed RNA polymerase specialized sigma24 family protein